MDTSASNRRLRVLLKGIRTGELIPRPEFQRRLVWTNKDKCYFVKTVLESLPFPEIYIAAGKVDAKTGEGSEVLVDGQQRITTLHQYFTDSPGLKLPSDIPRYADMAELKQIEFLEYKVVVRDLGSLPLDEIKKVFQRINSTSYGLNAMELNNSRYGGAFKKLAEWFSQQPTFERLRFFSASDIRRMNDVRFCLGILSTMMGTYFNRDKDIEEFLGKYDEVVSGEPQMRENIDETLKTIDNLNFDSNSRIGKKSDFFTLFVELYKVQVQGINRFKISDLRAELDHFYDKVDQAPASGKNDHSEYYKASLQASNDRSSRIKRGTIIRKIIKRNAK